MNRNKLMLLVAIVAAVVIVAGGFFLGVQPQLAQASDDRSSQSTIAQTNSSTQAQIAQLKAESKTLPAIKAQLASLKRSVPSSANTSAFLSEINAAAGSASVTVSSITIGDPEAYSPPVTTTTTTGTATSTATSSPSASAVPTAAPTPTAPAAPSAATNSSITSANFSVIPVSVAVQGSFAHALSFVRGAQSGARLFLIDSITSSGATGSASSLSWTFAGYIYVLTDTASSSTSASSSATSAPTAAATATPAAG